ncbi:hypothetical protein CDIK_3273 [Cucumispora dikerogammari]|nr:hypothetical protein CDIK_3273 [Cucumispora dikerogammari]
MLNQILSTTKIFYCKEQEYPEILSQPIIIYGDPKENAYEKKNIIIPKNLLFIETIINAKNFFDKELTKIDNIGILTKIELHFIDTHVANDDETVYISNELFSKYCVEEGKDIMLRTAQYEGTTKLILSIRPENETLENPLLKYLRTNPQKAFKCIIFLYTQKHYSICRTLHDALLRCELRIIPLIDIIDTELKEISEYLDTNSDCKIEKISDSVEYLNHKIKGVNLAIKKLEYLPNNIRSAITTCLKVFKEVSETLNVNGVSTPKINKMLIKKNNALRELFIEIQTSFKEQLGSEIKQNINQKMDITVDLKNRIWSCLEKCIDKQNPKDFMFFTEMINNVYSSLRCAVYPVRLETLVFRLDIQENILKEVKAKKVKNIRTEVNNNYVTSEDEKQGKEGHSSKMESKLSKKIICLLVVAAVLTTAIAVYLFAGKPPISL